jgi:hypothetical protein
VRGSEAESAITYVERKNTDLKATVTAGRRALDLADSAVPLGPRSQLGGRNGTQDGGISRPRATSIHPPGLFTCACGRDHVRQAI